MDLSTVTAPTARELALPALTAVAFAAGTTLLVAFDQGAVGLLLSDSMAGAGGVLHEFFHDARHLLGVPCH
jgi:hypothetical protein